MGWIKRKSPALLVVSIFIALYIAVEKIDSYNVDEYHDRIVRQLGDEFGIDFQFDSYRYSIFPGIEYVAVMPKINYGGMALSADEISIYLPISSLFLGRPVISEIRITAPEIGITRDKEGRWDFESLLAATGEVGGASSAVKRVSIIGGGIDIVDESVAGEPKKSRLDISTASFYSPGILIPARMNFTGTVIDMGRRTPAALSVKWKTEMDKTGLTSIQLDGSAKVLSLSSEYFRPYLAEAPPEWFIGKYISAAVNFSGDLLQDYNFYGGISISPEPVDEDSMNEEIFGNHENWLEFRGYRLADKFVLNKFQLHWPFINVTGYLEVDELKSNNPRVRAMLDSSSIDITNLDNLIKSKIFPSVWENLFLQNIYSGRFRLRDFEYNGRIRDLFAGVGGEGIGKFNGKLEIDDLSLKLQTMDRAITDINGVATIDSKKISFKDFSARYGSSTIRNISGSVNDYVLNPVLHAVIEADLDLSEFHEELMGNIKSKELQDALRPIKQLQGSLDFLFETKIDLVSAQPLEFSGDLQFRDISFHHTQFRFPVRNLNGTVLIGTSIIKIDDLSWYIGSSILRADGGIVDYLGDKYIFEVTVDAAGDASEYANILRLFFPKIKGVKGIFGSKLELSGTLDEMEFVHRLDITDTEFGYGKKFIKPNGLLSQVYVSGKITNQKELNVEKLDVKLGGSSILAKGGTNDISSLAEYNISLKTSKVKLGELHSYVHGLNKGVLIGEVKGYFNMERKRGRSKHDYKFDLHLVNADLEFLKRFDTFRDISLEGSVAGRLKVKSQSGMPVYVTGTLNAEDVGIDAGLARPIRGLRGKVEFLGDSLSMVDIPASLGNSTGKISLEMKFAMKPVVNLQIDGNEIFLEDIVGKEGDEKKEGPEKGGEDTGQDISPEWRIGVKSESGTLGDLKYKNLDTFIKYSNDRYDFDYLNFSAYGGRFEASGSINRNFHQEIFDVAFKMRDVNLKLFLDDVYHVSDKISGMLNLTADLSGNSLASDRMKKGLGGDVKFTIKDGLIQQFDGVSQVFTYINILPLFKSRTKEQKGRGVPFDTITGSFFIKEGVAKTENVSIEGDVLRASLVGEINLAEENLDLLLGLKPFTMIDKVVSNIPIAGKILTGEGKSLIVSYYRIGGGFDDVDSKAVPAESIARTAIGIVQRLLEPPARVISEIGSGNDKK